MKIQWHKIDDQAIIPTKTPAAAGFDIYTIEDDIEMAPFSQHLFSTGLTVVPEEGWWLMVFDRGSTGSKGLHVHCGVIDNDYRGEIFICIKNDNPYPVKFTDSEAPGLCTHKETKWINDFQIVHVIVTDYLVYPKSKAIAQIIPVAQPLVESKEINDDEFLAASKTQRGEGKLGSSGK